ncbi:pyridoxal phosphate-dependent aminotransferase [Hymenobacter sublimis]|uniref:Aminotransferase class I/II-fold pyridoxal phosphate-dependent enzyme n=1 Tax=Hymenobacter sublimis TaxID=2933777 RepID=A0ABY4J4Q9_9BACT|nr:aminotransferase class I/II-fold pyridoxal phosphate-dependent enzyme [Hymenobacter sublimis]UPL47826.1 aminotransferase class I/II-fold pyridoxal phosphate-dependent enzyme [Hymenobacter sublimis]
MSATSAPDVINLASGYGSFPPPAVATAAALRLLQATGPLPVAEVAGLPELRAALAEFYQQAGADRVQPEQVVVTGGTKAALFALLQAVLRPGDEVLLPTPNWFGFWELVTRAGGIVRVLPLNSADNYALSPETLRAALTPRTRLVLLSNPNNPTGRVYSRAEIAGWLRVTQDFPDLFVLSDEIYNGITFGPEPVPTLLSFPDPHQRHLVVNGYSKSLALIGWGIGYLVAPRAIAQACVAKLHATGSAVPVLQQHAALAATHNASAIAGGLVENLQPARHLMQTELALLPQVPPPQAEATYYFFPDLRAYLRPELEPAAASAELVARLQAAGVAVVDGATCGAPGFGRLSYAVPMAQLEQALERLRVGLGAPFAAR